MDKFVSFLLANSCPVWPEICLLADLLAGRQICQRGQIRLLDIFEGKTIKIYKYTVLTLPDIILNP